MDGERFQQRVSSLRQAGSLLPAIERIFVGRQPEMGQLSAALEDAIGGRGRLLALSGEPGIGKTRTAQELSAIAAERGAHVLWGRCYEDRGAPPFWPWLHALRAYVSENEADTLRSQMGRGAEDIAGLVSGLRDKLPDLKPPPATDPEQARFRLFDSITTFLKNASQERPLVLILEDLHFADRTSLLLLEFVAREIERSRLLILATYRDTEIRREHPLTLTLGELTRESAACGFHQVKLSGFGLKELGLFIELATGMVPPPSVVDDVGRRTEGNPLFVREVVRLICQQGETTQSEVGERSVWTRNIPDGLRFVIERRLNRLSAECKQALTVASVIGREFSLEQLARVCHEPSRGPPESLSPQPISNEGLLEALEEACEARLTEDVSQGVGSYRFTHSLIQEILAGGISAVRRAQLHGRTGEALEGLYSSSIEAHAADLAYHFAQAGMIWGHEKMVRYSLLAGEQALATYAPQEALSYFKRGLAAMEGQPTDGRIAALWFGMGRSQAATLERYGVLEALRSLTRAFDYFVEVGDVDRAVAAVEYPLPWMPGHRTGAAQLIARALELVPPESLDAGRLLSRYGAIIGTEEGDYQVAQHAFSRALAIARREGDVALETRTLVNDSLVCSLHTHYGEGLDRADRTIELARKIHDHHAEMTAHYLAAILSMVMGNLEGMRQHASANLALAERVRDRVKSAQAFSAKGMSLYIEGNWQAARSFNDRGLAFSPQEPDLLIVRVLLEYQSGELDQGAAYLARLLSVMRENAPGPIVEYAFPAMVLPLVERITGSTQQLALAQEACDAVLSSPSSLPFFAALARIGLSLLAVLRSDVEAAREQYHALEKSGVEARFLFIGNDRLLGLLAQIFGDFDRAAAHFEDALVFCRRWGYRPDLAWTCYDYAQALLQCAPKESGTGGGRTGALTLLDEALSISRELGMGPLLERASDLKRAAESLPDREPQYPDGLSPREVEVLRLISRGKSNREIATELVLSVRTVERHITNLYGKINGRSRAEATAYALTHGITNHT